MPLQSLDGFSLVNLDIVWTTFFLLLDLKYGKGRFPHRQLKALRRFALTAKSSTNLTEKVVASSLRHSQMRF